LQRFLKLETAAADVSRRRFETNARIECHETAGFRNGLIIDQDFAGQDSAPSRLAAFDQLPLQQQQI
jgi:hypothetical protein